MNTAPLLARKPENRQSQAMPGCTIEQVIALVAINYGIRKMLILHQSRCQAKAAKARQVAMYLSHVVLGRTLADVGKAFGRNRTTVSYACSLIEDLRDDRRFDEELDRLEAQPTGEMDHA